MAEKLDAQKLVASAGKLASPPTVFNRINETMNDQHITMEGIVEVIRVDPALVTRLLKIANSPMLGFPGRIDEIDRAVMILGTKHMRDLALAMLALDHFAGLTAAGVDPASFWRHSLGVAIMGRGIAAKRREFNPERLFLMGLLHEVGSLVLFQTQPDLAKAALELHRVTNQSLAACERSLFGIDHSDIGMELLRQMGLPKGIYEAVGSHHACPQGADAATVHVADVICHALELGDSGECKVPPLGGASWEALGLTVASMEAVIRDSEAVLEHTERMFLAAT